MVVATVITSDADNSDRRRLFAIFLIYHSWSQFLHDLTLKHVDLGIGFKMIPYITKLQMKHAEISCTD